MCTWGESLSLSRYRLEVRLASDNPALEPSPQERPKEFRPFTPAGAAALIGVKTSCCGTRRRDVFRFATFTDFDLHFERLSLAFLPGIFATTGLDFDNGVRAASCELVEPAPQALAPSSTPLCCECTWTERRVRPLSNCCGNCTSRDCVAFVHLVVETFGRVPAVASAAVVRCLS